MASGRVPEKGSALVLAPAGFLILLLLASISVDSAIAYSGRRQLENAVSAAANDAATAAILDGMGGATLQAGDEARPDALRAEQIANRSVMHSYSGGLKVRDVVVVVNGQTVMVRASGNVDYIFARAIPGVHHGAVVQAQAAAIVRFR